MNEHKHINKQSYYDLLYQQHLRDYISRSNINVGPKSIFMNFLRFTICLKIVKKLEVKSVLLPLIYLLYAVHH